MNEVVDLGYATATIEEDVEGNNYLHLDVNEWNKTVLLSLREELQQRLDKMKVEGKFVLFFYLPTGTSTKFHRMIRPIDHKVLCGENNEITLYGWEVD